MNIKVLVALVLGAVVLIGGGLLLAVSGDGGGGEENLEPVAGVKAVTGETSKDWGEIKMQDGDVEARFTIKNEGDQVLKLFDGTTSCACTNAKVITSGGESGYFGLHAKMRQVMEIAPGESAELVAIFDPAFHGPSGVGAISRRATIRTNDPDRPELAFSMTATVVR